MIAHLSGTLLEKHVQRLVVEVGGVGYDVQVPLSTFYAVGEPGAIVRLRIHTHVREDAIALFGFLTASERDWFDRLISVNGIGPKLALAVLSGIDTADLASAIRQNDLGRLTKIPGVGRKTAERLVVEIKDRLPHADAMGATDVPAPGEDVRTDLLSALANLGYQASSGEKAVDAVLRATDDRAFESLLRQALQRLVR